MGTAPLITPWNYNADLIDAKEVIASFNAAGKLQISPGTLKASIDFIIWLQQAFNGITTEDVTNVFVSTPGSTESNVTNTFVSAGANNNAALAAIQQAAAFRSVISGLGARIAALETELAFRPIPPPPQTQIYVCTQATFPLLAALAPKTFIYVSDYAHWIYYSGTGTTFADDGSNYYGVSAGIPNSVGWHAVDGSTVSFLKADGTLGSKVLKNVAANPSFIEVGAGTDTLVAAVAPGFTGSLAPGSVPAGTGLPVSVVSGLGTLAVNAAGAPPAFYSTLWYRQ